MFSIYISLLTHIVDVLTPLREHYLFAVQRDEDVFPVTSVPLERSSPILQHDDSAVDGRGA